MEILYQWIDGINDVLWSYLLIVLLLACAVWFTVRTRGVQFRMLGEMVRVLGESAGSGPRGERHVSSFQAFAVSLASRVGTGNLAGVATAIAIGGPGAIFWMWVIALLGASSAFVESTLAQLYKRKGRDSYIGGPAYYISQGLGSKTLAAFFSVAIIIALGFVGNMVQANSIAGAFYTAFNVPTWVTGIFTFIIAGFIFIGGTQRLASVVEKVVPLMAAIFLAGALIVLIARIKYVPEAFALIFKYAFQPQAIIGGGVGAALKVAISQGAKRGLFSNEAGMGSTPHAHAQANVKDPHEQGTVAMIGVFIDTFVVLTITALTAVITLYTKGGILADGTIPEAINKTNLAQTAFGTLLGEAGGNIFIAIALFFFAFSTVLGWNMFGKINVCYLFGKNEKTEKIAVIVYNVISLAFIFLGTLASNDLVWELSDMFNQLMVLPNVIALIACGGIVVSLTHFGKKNKEIKVVE